MSKILLETYDRYEEFGLDHRLGETAAYRKRCSEKYPADVRNYKAIDLIEKLAGQTPSPLAVKELNDAIAEYEAAAESVEFDSDPPPFEPKVSASFGSIGFSWFPKNIDEVVTALTTDARLATEEVKARSAA